MNLLPILGATSHEVLWQRLIWVGLATAVLAAAGFVFVLVMRRRLRSDQDSVEPFTLQDLREMLQRGDITRQEYETMRGAIVGMVAASKDRKKPSDTIDPDEHFDPPYDINPDDDRRP